MKNILSIVFALVVWAPAMRAQDAQTQDLYRLSGIIVDSLDNPLPGSEVFLKQDDAVLLSSFTDEFGGFLFENLTPGVYEIDALFIGFDLLSQTFTITDADINAGSLKLKRSSELLEGVTVIGDVQAVRQDGDTSMYNAQAYKVNPDATAEDLIRKMPGIDLTGGTPKTQGENITKVLVDGKPFFGDDVNATLRNLPAEVVSGIQIYDERSEQSQLSGFDDGNTTKTLNIVTREDKRQGMFGKVYAGYGADPEFDQNYYNAGLALNSFKGNQRVTLLAQTNNINIQNFSSEDMGGSGGGGRGGRGGGRGSRGGGDMMFSPRNGITNTNAIGLNYSNQWADKLKITGSYFFNNSHTVSLENIERTYLSESTLGQRYTESNTSTSDEFSHRINARLEYQPQEAHYFSFEPNLRIQSSNSLSNVNSKNLFDEAIPLNATENSYMSENAAVSGSYRFLYNYKFAKPGRTFSIANNSGLNNNDAENILQAWNTFEDSTLNYNTDQQSLIDSRGWNTYVNLNYTEPLSQRYNSQVNAGVRYQYSNSDKRTYDADAISGRYEHLNSSLSNQFESRYTTPFAGLALGYRDSVFNWNVGANYQYAYLENERVLPMVDTISQSFQNILPYAAFTYNLGKGSSIRLRYRTSTNTPSVSQLQDVIDNSNPLILRSGNPNLDQNYQHRIFANYRTSNPMRNSNFFAMIMSEITQDYVANHTTIAQEEMVVEGIPLSRGMQYIRPVNLNGHYRIMSHINYGFRVRPIKSNLNLSANIGTIRTPGLVNDELNYAQNNTIGLGIGLSSNINENIDFNVSTNANYSKVNNTLNTSADNAFYNQISRFDLNYITPIGLFVNTQLQHQYYEGIGSDFSQNFLLWNAAIGYKFLSKRQAEIRLQAYDILNQNQAISRTFTDIYTQDTRSNVLTQYFMLTFTYNLRYFTGNSSEKDFGQESGPRRRPH